MSVSVLSIIIPVYNKFALTRACLASLADATRGEDIEVIVVDNASSDETFRLCPALGKALFGDRFLYLPQEQNRNFSGANNIGAGCARGEDLFFLNNDTLAKDAFLPPLLDVLRTDTSLGAVGPLLLYPQKASLAERVQHCGVVLSLQNQIAHLYEFFPSTHPLVQKKRFLQVITGAALCMKKALYQAVGGFDEGFVNGFEDVELCARLTRMGLRQKVVPESVIYHYGGQSPGRTQHEAQNAQRCFEKCGNTLTVDEAARYREDGYRVFLSDWLRVEARKCMPLPPEPTSPHALQELRKQVLSEPFWLAGALYLARLEERFGLLRDAFESYVLASHFYPTPDVFIPFAAFLLRQKQYDALASVQEALEAFVTEPASRLTHLRELADACEMARERDLADQARQMMQENASFFSTTHASLRDIRIQAAEERL